MKDIQVILTNDEARVRELVAEGFCPVECSISGRSIVDGLVMDHHEDRSDLEAVSVRAIRDHAGARADDPRFVVVGACDADAAFAIAALAGLIPQNKATVELGNTIAIMDTDPIGKNFCDLPYGKFLSLWHQDYEHNRINRTQEGAYAAVDGWRKLASILDNPDAALKTRLSQVEQHEEWATKTAQDDMKRATIKNGACLIPGSKVFGFNVWHGRNEGAPSNTAAGWKNPVVVIYNEVSKSIGLACPNKNVAEELFGPGGLRNIFPKLGDWGGREQVGGSPRGRTMTLDDAKAAQDTIAPIIAERRPESATKPPQPQSCST